MTEKSNLGTDTDMDVDSSNKCKSSAMSVDGESLSTCKWKHAAVCCSSTHQDVLAYMKDDAQEHQKQHGEVMDLLKKQGEEMSTTLNGFLQIEMAHFEKEK